MRAQGRRKQRIRWTRRHEHGRASTCPSENWTRRTGETCRDELHHVANLASDAELDVCEIFSRPRVCPAAHMIEKRVEHSWPVVHQTHEWTNKCPTWTRTPASEPQMLYETDREVRFCVSTTPETGSTGTTKSQR